MSDLDTTGGGGGGVYTGGNVYYPRDSKRIHARNAKGERVLVDIEGEIPEGGGRRPTQIQVPSGEPVNEAKLRLAALARAKAERARLEAAFSRAAKKPRAAEPAPEESQ